jgi:hypothetical protein
MLNRLHSPIARLLHHLGLDAFEQPALKPCNFIAANRLAPLAFQGSISTLLINRAAAFQLGFIATVAQGAYAKCIA